ncbi:nuclear condensing complex subunit [Paraphysoderma sedebokerense]|nr:nuclear condensing complex subunit [Paraphysoderma sedebokerense]
MAKTTLSPSVRIATIFQEAQKSKTGHRKLFNNMRRVHEELVKSGNEREFVKAFVLCICKVLAVKKKDQTVNRVVDFISGYVHFSTEKDTPHDESSNVDENETLSSRLSGYLITFLLKGIAAKDKVTRLRVCQLIGLIIDTCHSMDDDIFLELKTRLFERLKDKEPSVRSQAIAALGQLATADDEESSKAVYNKFIELLQYDTSSEVRKAALASLEHNRYTLKFIVERARDADANIRRAVYKKSMQEVGDFRYLPKEDRNNLLKWGLAERDATVRKACAEMLTENWLKICNNNLIDFLINLNVFDGTIAEDALKACLSTDYSIQLEFSDMFWENLTPETALLMRTYCEHTAEKDIEAATNILPEVARYAYYLQKYCNEMFLAEAEKEMDRLSFIVKQLLKLAALLDFSDELGRRKMFTLLREMLISPDLSEEHIPEIVHLFRKTSVNERDFARVIIEMVTDIRDNDTNKQSLRSDMATIERRVSALGLQDTGSSDQDSEEAQVERILRILKSLIIIRSMLENNEEHLRDMTQMTGILNELIIPSLNLDEPVRETALACLGLCSISSKELAAQNLNLFLHSITHDQLSTRITSLKILVDLIMVHGLDNLASNSEQNDQNIDKNQHVFDILIWALDQKNAELLTAATEGCAKLINCKAIDNERILQKLVILYFHPMTSRCHRLRQCLAYFLTSFGYVSTKNRQSLRKLFVSTFLELARISQYYQSLEKKDGMISILQIGQQMIDWTDPAQNRDQNNEEDRTVHNELCQDLVQIAPSQNSGLCLLLFGSSHINFL